MREKGTHVTIVMMWFKWLALTALSLLITASVWPAGQESSDFAVSVNLVKVPISVFDSAGNMVSSLKSGDFRLWEDQAPQEIRSFGIDKNPVSIVLLLDTSESEKSELKKIREAADEFIQALSPGDRVTVITFDSEVKVLVDWTDDRKMARRALSRIRAGLRTALYDAMYVAAQEQLAGIDGRKAIILLTDCLNNQSSIEFDDAALTIVQSQASLYVVSKTVMVREQARKERRVIMLTDIYRRLFGSDDNYIDEFFKKREAEMTSLAERTGGRCFFPVDYDQIKDMYSEVARELKTQQFITYVSNQKLVPNSFHNISIEYLEPASKVVYRKGYYYLPKPGRKPLGYPSDY